jgi:hypothetical protein
VLLGESPCFFDVSPEVSPVLECLIRPFGVKLEVVVVGQKWPCWLSTALSLGFPVVGGFFPSRYHSQFDIPDNCKVKSWSTVESFKASSLDVSSVIALGSGNLNFLTTLEVFGCARLLFAADVYFPR